MNKAEFLKSIEGKAIVDFWAEWCGPCKMVGPVLQELADENGIQLIKINADEQPDLSQEFGISSIPAIFMVENGQVTRQIIGAKPKFALAKDLGL